MKKENKTAMKTMAIKARLVNQIRTDIYKKHLEENTRTKYYKEEVLTDEQKVELFNKWFKIGKEVHEELNNYKKKRQYKAEVIRLRQERNQKENV